MQGEKTFICQPIDLKYDSTFYLHDSLNALNARVINEYFFFFVPMIAAEICMVWVPSIYKNRKMVV